MHCHMLDVPLTIKKGYVGVQGNERAHKLIRLKSFTPTCAKPDAYVRSCWNLWPWAIKPLKPGNSRFSGAIFTNSDRLL